MTTRAAAKSKNKKPLETTLGKAPANTGDDPIDLSHLRKPIDTSVFGLRQVLQLYETATDEVRRYVTYECDVMYECRMCRTIFRSLANFILHKRNYCRECYNPFDHTNCRNNCQENELHVIQEEVEVPVSTPFQEQSSGTSSPIPPKCDSQQTVECFQPTNTNPKPSENKRNLSYVLRRLQGRQQSTLITEQCLSEDVSNESKSSEKEESRNNVALEKITEASSGVFQTMFRNMIDEYKGDMMKTQVMEIHNILENNEVILGSDGKIVASETEKSANFVCIVCNQRFSTKKTLTYHIKYKHNNTRLVYQCPECKDTFANAWSVFRHLYKIHRKTTAQVKRLRNQIHANIIRRDQQPETKNDDIVNIDSEVVPDLQEKANLENQQWMDDLEGDNDLQRCGGCGRKFERKAALHSHSQFCSKRIAICNSIKENSTKRTQSDKTKMSKTTINTNIECIPKGSRRRKQLISQKMCRVDYVKDNETSSENTVEDSKDYKHDQDTKGEINQDGTQNKQNSSQNETDVIEVRDDSNDSENEQFVLIQNLDEVAVKEKISDRNLKPNITTVLILEEPRSFSRSESRSSDCDDVIYVDTVKLSPIQESPDLIEPVNNINEELKVKGSPTIIKNSIITRSMKNLKKISSQENLNCLLNHFTVESSDITMPIQTKIADNLKPTENEINFELMPKEFSNINRDELEQTNCTESNKRKGTEPQPGNSKRKKDEVLPENVQTEECLTKIPKITLETKSSKFIDKHRHTCLPCKKSFKSNKSLMKHMSVHFNWYRYQCRSCSFMSYSRSKCDRHVEVKHAIYNNETLKNTVLHIPNWKTVDKSTNFTERCKKYKPKDVDVNKQELNRNPSGEQLSELHNKDEMEAMEENMEEVQKDESLSSSSSNPQEVLETESSIITEPVKDAIPPCDPDVQDPSLRKMIMEVIFGNQTVSEIQEEKESEVILESQKKSDSLKDLEQKPDSHEVNSSNTEDATEGFLGFQNSTEVGSQFKTENPALSSVVLRENPRPIRNRVPTVQKDFLYDMAQILKPKVMKDKETHATSAHKELDAGKKEKQKSVKMCTKESKPKNTIQLSITNSKKLPVNKIVEHVVQEPCADIVQDINMNSKDLKKHVTGDCD